MRYPCAEGQDRCRQACRARAPLWYVAEDPDPASVARASNYAETIFQVPSG